MTQHPLDDEPERLPPPLFNPDPRLIRSRDGSKRATRKFREGAERRRREALEAHLAKLERDDAARSQSD